MSSFSSSVQRSNVFIHKNGTELDFPDQLLQYLIKFLSTPKNLFLRDLSKFIYTNDRSLSEDDPENVSQNINKSLEEVYNSLKSFAECFIKYLLYAAKFQGRTHEEIVQRFTMTPKLFLCCKDNVSTSKQIKILISNLQRPASCKTEVLYQQFLLTHPPDDLFLKFKSNFIANPEDPGFISFVSVLNNDYTRSSKGYTERKYNRSENTRETGRKFQINAFPPSLEISLCEEQVSLPTHDEHDNNSYMISRYFESFDWNSTNANKRLWFESNDSAANENFNAGEYDRISINSNKGLWSESDDSAANENFNTGQYDRNSFNSNKGLWYESDDSAAIENFNVWQYDRNLKEIPFDNNKSDHNDFRIYDLQGFENPCFEEDGELLEDGKYILGEYSFINMINNNWRIRMENVSEEPRTAKKVSFQADATLVTVFNFVKDDDDYKYSISVLNRLRFQNRIEEFEMMMAEFLTPEHRERVFHRINQGNFF